MAYNAAQILAKKQAIRDQLLDRIEEVTAEANPSYNIDGEQIAWSDYLMRLRKELAEIEAAIAALEPFEIHSRGYT